eukprot:TRINITY_DN12499_c0_g1_i2.p1 TRINITY_DN12499_c0_g1~~TRINITY_DN12499_c0_g1_i2.p1  ORF type:complete len:469 (+),score=94.30 TRINITY_DN12499_c0_g1_i2:70-1407(+)
MCIRDRHKPVIKQYQTIQYTQMLRQLVVLALFLGLCSPLLAQLTKLSPECQQLYVNGHSFFGSWPNSPYRYLSYINDDLISSPCVNNESIYCSAGKWVLNRIVKDQVFSNGVPFVFDFLKEYLDVCVLGAPYPISLPIFHEDRSCSYELKVISGLLDSPDIDFVLLQTIFQSVKGKCFIATPYGASCETSGNILPEVISRAAVFGKSLQGARKDELRRFLQIRLTDFLNSCLRDERKLLCGYFKDWSLSNITTTEDSSMKAKKNLDFYLDDCVTNTGKNQICNVIKEDVRVIFSFDKTSSRKEERAALRATMKDALEFFTDDCRNRPLTVERSRAFDIKTDVSECKDIVAQFLAEVSLLLSEKEITYVMLEKSFNNLVSLGNKMFSKTEKTKAIEKFLQSLLAAANSQQGQYDRFRKTTQLIGWLAGTLFKESFNPETYCQCKSS